MGGFIGVAIVVWLGLAGPAGAVPPPAGCLSLEDVEILALSRHPLLREADSRCRSLASRREESRHRHGPELQAGYHYNTNPVFRETDRSFSSVQQHAEVGVVLPLLKRLAAVPGEVERASCQLKVGEAERRRAAQQALWEVRELFLDHWEARRREDHHRRQASLLEEALALARRGAELGEVLPQEVLSVEARWLEAREQAAQAARVRENRHHRLATLLGLPSETLQLASHAPGPREIPGFPALARMARASRPELAAVPWRVREARLAGERALAHICDVNLEARYYVDQYREIGTRSGAYLMARVSAPLETFQLLRQRQEASRHEAAAQEARGEALGQQVEREVAAALERFQAAEAGLRQARQHRRLAEEQLRSRKLMAEKPSLLASASGVEVLLARAQVEAAAGEEAVREAERERAYFALLYAVGTDTREISSINPRPSAPAAPSPPLAMWLYYPDRLLASGEMAAVLPLAREKGISTLYLCLNRTLISPGHRFAPRLREFLGQAHRQGVSVEALLDETSWLLPEGRPDLLTYLRWLEDFQAAGEAGTRFTAVHLDLEIHQLPRWREKKSLYSGYLLETVKLVKERAKGLPVWLDLPVWLEEEGIPGWPQLLQMADGVVFMAYELKDPRRLAAALAGEVAALQPRGIPYRVGVQVRDFPGEPALRAFLARVQGLLQPAPVGFALFQYEEVKKWR